jgi:hypothetical protein
MWRAVGILGGERLGGMGKLSKAEESAGTLEADNVDVVELCD